MPGTPWNCARPSEASRATYFLVVDPSRNVARATFKVPPSPPKPTADTSFDAGKLTVPKPSDVSFMSRLAPLPTNHLASVMRSRIRSPSIRVDSPTRFGSTTSETTARDTSTLALPWTNPAIEKPIEPPTWNVASVLRNEMPAAASGLSSPDAVTAACVQSSRPPSVTPDVSGSSATLVRFTDRPRFRPTNCRSGTPCNATLPRLACTAV